MAMFVGSILQNYGKRCSLRFREACTEFIIIYLKAKIKPRHACIQQRFQTGQGHFVLQVPCTVLHTTPPHSSTRSQCRIKWRSNIDKRTMLRRGGDFFVNQQAIPPSHSPSRDQYKPSKSAALNTHNFAKKFLYPVPAGRVKKNNLETTLRIHQDR